MKKLLTAIVLLLLYLPLSYYFLLFSAGLILTGIWFGQFGLLMSLILICLFFLLIHAIAIRILFSIWNKYVSQVALKQFFLISFLLVILINVLVFTKVGLDYSAQQKRERLKSETANRELQQIALMSFFTNARFKTSSNELKITIDTTFSKSFNSAHDWISTLHYNFEGNDRNDNLNLSGCGISGGQDVQLLDKKTGQFPKFPLDPTGNYQTIINYSFNHPNLRCNLNESFRKFIGKKFFVNYSITPDFHGKTAILKIFNIQNIEQ